MISRVLGMVRNIAFTALIPAGSLDAFLVAFKLPNMVRELVGEGAMNAAVVPVLSETLENESEQGYRELVSAAMSVMIIVLGGVTFLGLVIVPLLLRGSNVLQYLTRAAPVQAAQIELTVSLARWTFPYLFFIGLAAFAMGALFTVKHYGTPAWAPALLNVAIIMACFMLRNWFPDPSYALVVGVWVGGVAQVVVLYAALAKHGKVWLPNFRLGHPGVWRILWLMVPVVFGQAAGEVNKLVDTLFALQLAQGTVKALFLANQLVQLPLAVFGVATALAVLPAVSRAATRQNFDDFRETLMHGFRQSFFLIVPALLGLICLRTPIVRLLFERGEFLEADTHRTATALAIYAAGLLAFAWMKVAVSGFYGVQDTRTPVIIGSASMLLNIVLNCFLVGFLGYRGLALATTIAFTVNFVLLFVVLCKKFGRLWDGEFLWGLLRMTLAAGMMIALVYAIHLRLGYYIAQDHLAGRAIAVAVPVVVGGLTYLALCRFLAVPELEHFVAAFRRPPRKG